MNLEVLLYWITERESIRRRREAGEPAPWTSDPVLRDYRFCNVRRENDAVTRHIAARWRAPHADDPHLWFAMAVARFINWPDTLDELGFPVPWDREHFKRVLSDRMQRGEVTFGPAYKITGGRNGTISHVADDVLNRLWRSREHMSPQPGTTLAAYCARLMDFDGVGSFMSGQVVADLRFVEPLLSASDRLSDADIEIIDHYRKSHLPSYLPWERGRGLLMRKVPLAVHSNFLARSISAPFCPCL